MWLHIEACGKIIHTSVSTWYNTFISAWNSVKNIEVFRAFQNTDVEFSFIILLEFVTEIECSIKKYSCLNL